MSPDLAELCPRFNGKWLILAAACSTLACSAQNSSVSADVPRRAVPIPACVMALPIRAEGQRQFMRQLSDADLWRAVFPAFNATEGKLPEGSPVCTGDFLFNDPQFKGAQVRHPWPIAPEPADLVFGAGPKRTKIVWFKTHRWDDGSVGGVVAMIRAEEDFAEVYGIGIFRGAPETSRFATERIGGTVVVTATDDRCTGKPAEQPCESWIRVLMPWKGRLSEQVSIAVERREVAAKGELGASGPVTYRMTSTPMFEPSRIRLLEQIQAVDSTGRKLRNVELERRIELVEGKLQERQASLWDRVVGGEVDVPGKSAAQGDSVEAAAGDRTATSSSATSGVGGPAKTKAKPDAKSETKPAAGLNSEP